MGFCNLNSMIHTKSNLFNSNSVFVNQSILYITVEDERLHRILCKTIQSNTHTQKKNESKSKYFTIADNGHTLSQKVIANIFKMKPFNCIGISLGN